MQPEGEDQPLLVPGLSVVPLSLASVPLTESEQFQSQLFLSGSRKKAEKGSVHDPAWNSSRPRPSWLPASEVTVRGGLSGGPVGKEGWAIRGLCRCAHPGLLLLLLRDPLVQKD